MTLFLTLSLKSMRKFKINTNYHQKKENFDIFALPKGKWKGGQ
jgi:hypothetical protein